MKLPFTLAVAIIGLGLGAAPAILAQPRPGLAGARIYGGYWADNSRYGQNFGRNFSQDLSQNLGQNFSQNLGQSYGRNYSQNLGQNLSQNLGQNLSQSSSGWNNPGGGAGFNALMRRR